MRASAALRVALLLATLAAADARAQERYDLDSRTGWRPQEVTTRTMLTTGRLMLFGSAASEEQLRDFRRYLSNRAVIVEKCLEVDVGGNPTKVLAFIRDWTDRRGDREAAVTDTSLRGTSITVTGNGRDRSWRFVGEAPEVSDDARQWLDANFGVEPPIGTLVENLLPRRKVAVGESWEVDPAPLLQRIWRYPVASVTGKGTLLSVGGGNAHVHFDFSVASRGMPLGARDTVVPWLKGGTLRITLEATVALRGKRRIIASQYRSGVDGEIDAGLGSGATSVGVDSTLTQLQSLAEGGELPSLAR